MNEYNTKVPNINKQLVYKFLINCTKHLLSNNRNKGIIYSKTDRLFLFIILNDWLN